MNLKSIKQIKSSIGAKRPKGLYYATDFSYALTLNVSSKEIIGRNIFNILNEVEEEDLAINIKKILPNSINSKLFKNNFKEDKLLSEKSFYSKLNSLLVEDKDNFVNICEEISQKILEDKVFKENVCIIFTRSTLNTTDDMRKVIFCTVNKVTSSSLELIVEDGKIQYVDNLIPRIHTNAPLEGFIYPDIEKEDNALVENKDGIVYYTSKANNINTSFVSQILECEIKLTEKQEKEKFNEVITKVVGGKVTPNTLYKIYRNISNRFDLEENEEDRIITPLTMSKVLKDVDLDIDKETLDTIYEDTFGFNGFQFKVDSIVPDRNKKSITIVTANNDTEIKIKPDFLQNIKQIVDENGETALVIPLKGDQVLTNGFHTKLED